MNNRQNNQQDIRWKQRFENFQKALSQLKIFLQKASLSELNTLEKQGLIQCFEYNHELAWKVLADFIKHKGNQEIYGSLDATREAFNLGLIKNGEIWMQMIKLRNITSHTYHEDITEKIILDIKGKYYQEFTYMEQKFTELL